MNRILLIIQINFLQTGSSTQRPDREVGEVFVVFTAL